MGALRPLAQFRCRIRDRGGLGLLFGVKAPRPLRARAHLFDFLDRVHELHAVDVDLRPRRVVGADAVLGRAGANKPHLHLEHAAQRRPHGQDAVAQVPGHGLFVAVNHVEGVVAPLERVLVGALVVLLFQQVVDVLVDVVGGWRYSLRLALEHDDAGGQHVVRVALHVGAVQEHDLVGVFLRVRRRRLLGVQQRRAVVQHVAQAVDAGLDRVVLGLFQVHELLGPALWHVKVRVGDFLQDGAVERVGDCLERPKDFVRLVVDDLDRVLGALQIGRAYVVAGVLLQVAVLADFGKDKELADRQAQSARRAAGARQHDRQVALFLDQIKLLVEHVVGVALERGHDLALKARGERVVVRHVVECK